MLPLVVLALGILGMPSLLLSSGGLARLDRLQGERETVELEISRLAKKIDHLRSQARTIKRDPTAVERSARDELGLLRRTEIVFHFEPDTD
jgi:cell division protein FtsB